MATPILTVVGAGVGFAFGGPAGAQLGAMAGSLVGGLIDNVLLAGSQKVEGPRLKDLSVTASTYGSPIPLFYGPENRAAGNIFWSTGLIESKNTESAGGKGGGGSKQVSYSYRTSLAVGLGEGRSTTFGAWPKLKRAWANGKLIFDLEDVPVTSPPTLPPSEPTADVGMVATKANGTHAVFETLRFYQGTATQAIDPTIEAHLGVGNTPAYRHTMYAVIQDLQLADFGNVLPNLEFEIEADESITDGAIVKDICRRAGAPLVSASSLSTTRRGFIVSRPGTATAALEPLALVGGFDVADQRGQIRFVRRGRAMKATVPLEAMGARQADGTGGSAGSEPIRFERLDDLPLPKEAALSYRDPALDYQVGTQRAARHLGNSENNLSHEVAVTLSADEARALADRLLWEAWAARRTARFAVDDGWCRRNAADVLGLPVAGSVVPFKIQSLTRGANGVIELEARFEDPEIYNSIAAGAAGTLPANALQRPGITELILMDAPLLRPVDDNDGFYWAVTAESAGWRGAQVLRSSDGGATYSPLANVATRAAIGTVVTALPAGPSAFWDRGNSLTVVLTFDEGEMESVSEDAVYSGKNAAWLGGAAGQGGEVLQFATATLVAPRTYELRDFLRGRLGTEHAIAGHGANETFVLLDPNFLKRNDFGAGDWNRARLYKPVSILRSEADTAAQAFTNTGEAKRPLAVAQLRARRETLAGSPPSHTNDLTVRAFRRSRILAPGLGYGAVALGEASEAYEIDIVISGAVVNTYETAALPFVYTEAMQAADGITLGNPNQALRMYQMSAPRGRGHVAEISL